MKTEENSSDALINTSSNFSTKTNQSFPSSKKQLVIQLVKEWHQSFEVQKIDYHECYQVFIHKYSKAHRMKIRFDNSLSRMLVQLSKQTEFLQFNEDKQNQLKKTLEFINEILKEKQFISERQYNKFKNQFLSNNLQDSIYLLENNLIDQGYIKKKNQSEPLKKVEKDMPKQQKQILLKLWEISMMPSLETFWKFVLKEKLQHRKIFVIFQIYQRLLQEQASRQLRKQVSFYLKEIIDRKKQTKITPSHQLDMSIVAYDQILNQKAQYISCYLNKERWQLYKKQYELLTEFLLKRCNKKEIKFQPYGSFQSKFYVVKYSDIDIGLFYEGMELNQRQKICNTLVKICEAVNADRAHITNCILAKVYKEDKIKIPFVKVVYNSSYGKNKDVVPTMDIIINNYEGLQNSKMLSLYAEDEYVLKFCNLIKYWAVNRSLINMYRKIQGLSSYGVLLMCLYYLMVTKQLPYLKKINKQYVIGLDKFDINKNFLDNFIGFLKFYSYEYIDYETKQTIRGQFHKQRRIVCLLEEHEGKKVYDEYNIINMYDFIDGSNPGRMKTHLYDRFKDIFSETLQRLEQRSLSFLEIIYSEDEKETENKSKFPRRGNRFLN